MVKKGASLRCAEEGACNTSLTCYSHDKPLLCEPQCCHSSALWRSICKSMAMQNSPSWERMCWSCSDRRIGCPTERNGFIGSSSVASGLGSKAPLLHGPSLGSTCSQMRASSPYVVRTFIITVYIRCLRRDMALIRLPLMPSVNMCKDSDAGVAVAGGIGYM